MSHFVKWTLIGFWSFAVALAGISESAHAAQPLEKVEHSKVCMVNDTYFGTAQIPVEVGDATYYGCCEGCKKTLSTDEKARFAIDPHSKKRVDKARAVIGKDEKGRVFYFENDANLKAYSKN